MVKGLKRSHEQCQEVWYPGKKESKESEVAQSCPTLCDPMDCSLPGSSIHRIFQARQEYWSGVPLPSPQEKLLLLLLLSRFSHVRLCSTP